MSNTFVSYNRSAPESRSQASELFFITLKIGKIGRTDRRTGGRADGRTGGRAGGRTDGRTDRPTDGRTCGSQSAFKEILHSEHNFLVAINSRSYVGQHAGSNAGYFICCLVVLNMMFGRVQTCFCTFDSSPGGKG